MGHNYRFCRRRNETCQCLTCKHDRRVEDPTTDTKCCDLINHRGSCQDEEPCRDYEPEESREHEALG